MSIGETFTAIWIVSSRRRAPSSRIWGIGKCKKQAEHIMDAGKANAYDHAVAWLRTARDIYFEHQRQTEWRAYRDSLLGLHARKYKLVPMLRALG